MHQNGLLSLERNANQHIKRKRYLQPTAPGVQGSLSQESPHQEAELKLRHGVQSRLSLAAFLSLSLAGQSVRELSGLQSWVRQSSGLPTLSAASPLSPRQSWRSMKNQGTKGKEQDVFPAKENGALLPQRAGRTQPRSSTWGLPADQGFPARLPSLSLVCWPLCHLRLGRGRGLPAPSQLKLIH